jgi:hypothetical protein
VKHGGGSNDHRSNGGIVPPKGPPQGGGGSINSRVQQVARTLPRLNVNQVSIHEIATVKSHLMLVTVSPLFFPDPPSLCQEGIFQIYLEHLLCPVKFTVGSSMRISLVVER